jgi:serine/threonine protein kinase
MFGLSFGPQIDMWSLGCVLAEVDGFLYFLPPFGGYSKLPKKIKKHLIKTYSDESIK